MLYNIGLCVSYTWKCSDQKKYLCMAAHRVLFIIAKTGHIPDVHQKEKKKKEWTIWYVQCHGYITKICWLIESLYKEI